MKLIKINTDHYVVVDENAEIKEGDYIINIQRMHIYPTPVCADDVEYRNRRNDVFKKITHSTQPIEEGTTIHGIEHKRWNHVKFIDLSEVKELIGDVDVAEISYLKKLESSNQDKNWIGYGKGIDGVSKEKWKRIYNQSLEDNKEKKYTEEDVRKAIAVGFDWCHQKLIPQDWMINNYIQQLQQPKTEWDVEFDSQGKLKLKK